jgi:hypothetical protein
MQVGIEPRFLDWKAIKVKPSPENRISANHSSRYKRVDRLLKREA